MVGLYIQILFKLFLKLLVANLGLPIICKKFNTLRWLQFLVFIIHISEYIYIYYLRKKVIEAVFDCTWIWDLETCHQYGHLFLGRTYCTSFCVPFLFGTSLIQTLDYLLPGEYLCFIYLDAETLVILEIQHTSQYKFGIWGE